MLLVRRCMCRRPRWVLSVAWLEARGARAAVWYIEQRMLGQCARIYVFERVADTVVLVFDLGASIGPTRAEVDNPEG